VVAREWMPVGGTYVLVRGGSGAPLGAAVGTRTRLPVERTHVHDGGKGRTPRGAAVGAR
jgi:hypothetical protein